MTATHKVLDLGRYTAERCLALHYISELGCVFILTDRQAVGVLLPTGTDIVPMTEQAFVAVDEFGHRFPCVARSPSSRIEVLLLLIRYALFQCRVSSIRVQHH